VPLSGKDDHPALLPPGNHRMTLDDLRSLCVEGFPHSTSRPRIAAGLEQVLQRVEKAGIRADVWIDGSFLTEKPDPEDADIVLRISIADLATPTREQTETLDWLNLDLKPEFLCDSYFFFVFPGDDARADFGAEMEAYWKRQFGFSRSEDAKGIAVLQTGAGR